MIQDNKNIQIMNTLNSNYDIQYYPELLIPVAIPVIAIDDDDDIKQNHGQHENNNFKFPLDDSAENEQIRDHHIEQLTRQGFSKGLATSLGAAKISFPLRIWVVDNSGSMLMADGYLLTEASQKHKVKIVDSTRWEELEECVIYHAQMAALIEAPTSFRLLNAVAGSGPQQFGVANIRKDQIPSDLQNAHAILQQTRPTGATPLTQHIIDVQHALRAMAADLNQRGQRVALIIATDGLPTDADGRGGAIEQNRFLEALRSLERLPVWVVFRLCTSERSVVEFYNSLDKQLELSMEVLDDFVGEARQITAQNPWLNYALPLHRIREFGFHDRLFDMLDERPLTKGELREFCALLFGVKNINSLPDPGLKWSAFLKAVHQLQKMEERQWNPVTKKIAPWIDVHILQKMHSGSSLKAKFVWCKTLLSWSLKFELFK
jgi:hypothetical protein